METERLLLSVPKLEEATFFIKLMNSPGWIKHIGDRSIHTIEDAQNYIQTLIENNKNFGFCLNTVYLKTTNSPIGICGLIQRDYLDHPDLGFAILPEYEGRGYTKEASLLWINNAKEHLKLTRLDAITSPSNTKSIGLLKSLGFKTYTPNITQKDTSYFYKVF